AGAVPQAPFRSTATSDDISRHASNMTLCDLTHFAVSRPLAPAHATPLAQGIGEASDEQPAIRSRWQHDAVPPWRPVPPRLVCEVRVTNLDLLVAGRSSLVSSLARRCHLPEPS